MVTFNVDTFVDVLIKEPHVTWNRAYAFDDCVKFGALCTYSDYDVTRVTNRSQINFNMSCMGCITRILVDLERGDPQARLNVPVIYTDEYGSICKDIRSYGFVEFVEAYKAALEFH